MPTKENSYHLMLKFKWFDLIKQGKKKIEYRDTRTRNYERLLSDEVKFLVLHKGYTSITITVEKIKAEKHGLVIWSYLGKIVEEGK